MAKNKIIPSIHSGVIERPKVDEPEIVTKTEELVQVSVKEEIKEVEGVITGVQTSLNIRSNPEVKPNNQIAVLGKGTKIIVVEPDNPVKNGGEEWYKVKVSKNDGQVGYAMKKFIKVL